MQPAVFILIAIAVFCYIGQGFICRKTFKHFGKIFESLMMAQAFSVMQRDDETDIITKDS